MHNTNTKQACAMRDSGMLEDMISRSTFVDVFNHIALAAAPDAKAQKRKMDPFLPLPFWYNTHTHTRLCA